MICTFLVGMKIQREHPYFLENLIMKTYREITYAMSTCKAVCQHKLPVDRCPLGKDFGICVDCTFTSCMEWVLTSNKPRCRNCKRIYYPNKKCCSNPNPPAGLSLRWDEKTASYILVSP